MKRIRVTLFLLGLATVMLMACQVPRNEPTFNGPVFTFLDVPITYLHEHTEKYLGTVFEDRFMFDGIYRAKDFANPDKQGSVTETKTYIVARPIAQNSDVIQIQIAPGQVESVRKKLEAEKTDILKARIRFTGIAPGGQPSFDLIAILE